MKISTNSWHYRYIRKLGFSVPSNLCPYFWKLMFCLAVPVAVLVALVFILAGLTLIVIWISHHLAATLIVLAIVAAIALGLLGLAWLFFSNASHRAFSVIGTTRAMGGISEGAYLTGQYIVAVHHKLCPRLEFIDGEA